MKFYFWKTRALISEEIVKYSKISKEKYDDKSVPLCFPRAQYEYQVSMLFSAYFKVKLLHALLISGSIDKLSASKTTG